MAGIGVSGVDIFKDIFKRSFPLGNLLFSCLVISDSSRSHKLQHVRPPCPSTSPGACSNSRPLRQWCHPIISSSLIPFSSCPQSFPASGSFSMSWLSTSDGQSIGVSASALVLPVQGWSRDSQESSPTPQFKSINSSVLSLLYSPTLTSVHLNFITSLYPRSGRPPGKGNGNPFQYPGQDNPMGKGARWIMVHGVIKSCTWLSDAACTLCPEITYLLLPPSLESVIGHGNHQAVGLRWRWMYSRTHSWGGVQGRADTETNGQVSD